MRNWVRSSSSSRSALSGARCSLERRGSRRLADSPPLLSPATPSPPSPPSHMASAVPPSPPSPPRNPAPSPTSTAVHSASASGKPIRAMTSSLLTSRRRFRGSTSSFVGREEECSMLRRTTTRQRAGLGASGRGTSTFCVRVPLPHPSLPPALFSYSSLLLLLAAQEMFFYPGNFRAGGLNSGIPASPYGDTGRGTNWTRGGAGTAINIYLSDFYVNAAGGGGQVRLLCISLRQSRGDRSRCLLVFSLRRDWIASVRTQTPVDRTPLPACSVLRRSSTATLTAVEAVPEPLRVPLVQSSRTSTFPPLFSSPLGIDPPSSAQFFGPR